MQAASRDIPMSSLTSKNYPAIARNLVGHVARLCANRAGAIGCIVRIAPSRVTFFVLVLLLQDRLAARVSPGYYHYLGQRFPDLEP